MPLIGNMTYDELEAGDSATYSRTLTEEEIVLFATITGDVNPVHLDPEYAGKTIFKERVGHGMWSGALISYAVANILPGAGTIYLEQSLRFLLPIKIRDSLTVTITVKEKQTKNRVLLDCRVVNQHDKLVVDGQARVIAPTEKVSMEKPELPSIKVEKNGSKEEENGSPEK